MQSLRVFVDFGPILRWRSSSLGESYSDADKFTKDQVHQWQDSTSTNGGNDGYYV